MRNKKQRIDKKETTLAPASRTLAPLLTATQCRIFLRLARTGRTGPPADRALCRRAPGRGNTLRALAVSSRLPLQGKFLFVVVEILIEF